MNARFVSAPNPRWIDACILLGSAFFILALILSAVFDPTIRLLHALQALIYVAIVLLTRLASPWGFGAGLFIATFWNYTNFFITTFIRSGLQQIPAWVQTGHLGRPDLLVAVIAAAAHLLIIVACAVGFLRLHPGVRQYFELLGGGFLAIAFFVAFIFSTGPQYIPLIHRVFHV